MWEANIHPEAFKLHTEEASVICESWKDVCLQLRWLCLDYIFAEYLCVEDEYSAIHCACDEFSRVLLIRLDLTTFVGKNYSELRWIFDFFDAESC